MEYITEIFFQLLFTDYEQYDVGISDSDAVKVRLYAAWYHQPEYYGSGNGIRIRNQFLF